MVAKGVLQFASGLYTLPSPLSGIWFLREQPFLINPVKRANPNRRAFSKSPQDRSASYTPAKSASMVEVLEKGVPCRCSTTRHKYQYPKANAERPIVHYLAPVYITLIFYASPGEEFHDPKPDDQFPALRFCSKYIMLFALGMIILL